MPAATDPAVRTCRYPGCTRPAEAADGPGRPPAYCDDPAHTRASAFRARQAVGAAYEASAGAVAGEATEPVTFARVRAGLLVERVEAAVLALATMTADVVAELRTLGDVEAVEVELETVSASADQRAAEARSAAASAENRRRTAEAAALEADQRREEAEAAAAEALAAEAQALDLANTQAQAAEAARAEADQFHADLTAMVAERDQAQAEARDLVEQLAVSREETTVTRAALAGERETLELTRERVVVVEAQLVIAEQDVTDLNDRLAHALVRAEQAEDSVGSLQQTLGERDQTVTGLQDEIREAASHLAQAQVRLEEQAAQREQLREQLVARDERISALEDERGRALSDVAAITAQLHAEQASARTAAEVAERTTTARLAEVRALYEERLSELRGPTTPPKG
jgi:colicin import membrane protein